MINKGTVRIDTDRLILRRITVEDSGAIFKNWTGDSRVTKYLKWQAHRSIDETAELIRSWEKNYDCPYFYHWGIVSKDLGEPIGTISAAEVNEVTETIEIGYCIGYKWWHMGYTSEAFSAVIDYLFKETGVNRIEARHDAANINSGGVMRKCGLKYEGTLRQGIRNNRGLVDVCVYSLLAYEYFLK